MFVTLLECTSHPKQDDEALWNMYTSVMRLPPNRIVPEEEKNETLQMLLSMSGGRAGAIDCLEYVKQIRASDPVQIGVRRQTLLVSDSNPPRSSPKFQCPNVCKTVEFDNIKVFYHLARPNVPLEANDWLFYLARPGASASECINWATEGIDVKLCGRDGEWSACPGLVVAPGARVHIFHTSQNERRIREIVFAGNDPSIPALYLE